jgi:hypothetical protein
MRPLMMAQFSFHEADRRIPISLTLSCGNGASSLGGRRGEVALNRVADHLRDSVVDFLVSGPGSGS